MRHWRARMRSHGRAAAADFRRVLVPTCCRRQTPVQAGGAATWPGGAKPRAANLSCGSAYWACGMRPSCVSCFLCLVSQRVPTPLLSSLPQRSHVPTYCPVCPPSISMSVLLLHAARAHARSGLRLVGVYTRRRRCSFATRCREFAACDGWQCVSLILWYRHEMASLALIADHSGSFYSIG